jgi:hypothetical protein
MPLLLIGRFARAEVDALCPEFCCATGLRSATKDIRSLSDLDVNETGSHDRGF